MKVVSKKKPHSSFKRMCFVVLQQTLVDLETSVRIAQIEVAIAPATDIVSPLWNDMRSLNGALGVCDQAECVSTDNILTKG